MPNPKPVRGTPASWVAKGGTWPAGPFKPNAPAGVLYAAEIATSLRAAIDESGQSMTAIAEALSVARSTVYDALNGTVFIDSYTLAAAEAHFGVRLWPDRIPVT